MFSPNAEVIRGLGQYVPQLEQWQPERPKYLDREQPDWDTRLEKAAQFNRYYQVWTRDYRAIQPLDLVQLTNQLRYGYHEFAGYLPYYLFLRKEKEEKRYPAQALLEILHALHQAGLLRGLPDYRSHWATEAEPGFKQPEAAVQHMDLETLSRFISASLEERVFSFPIQKGVLTAAIRRAVKLVS